MARPLKFDTPEDLAESIDQYFIYCDNGKDEVIVTPRGDVAEVHRPIPYTIEGLADWLDVTVQTVWNYEKRDLFFDVISRAKTKIQKAWIEGGLYNKFNPKVVSLLLQASNKDYVPQQNHEVTVTTIEDKLRQIEMARQAALPAPDMPPDDTIDAEYDTLTAAAECHDKTGS